jgi:hypothetical protein
MISHLDTDNNFKLIYINILNKKFFLIGKIKFIFVIIFTSIILTMNIINY